MLQTHFYNVAVVLPDRVMEDVSVVISNEQIESIGNNTAFGSGESIDWTGLLLMPGSIDVHIHGATGVDVNAADLDGLVEIARFLARNGVTSWMPTLVPDSDDNYERTIATIDRLMEIQNDEPMARAVGVHYEGVFANEKMCGALRPQYFKKFPDHQLAELPKLAAGVHMTTFAPEVDGGIGLANELRRQGWVASIGHTRADVETLDRAYDAGARHLTHFFNAMTGLHHRDVGVVGWALSRPEVTFDIIADGMHVHPAMLEFACRTKTPERVSLISDSVAPTGLGDGEFTIWGETVTVEGRRSRYARGSIAGSVITMLDAIKRMTSIGFSLPEVSRMASGNPAKLLGIDKMHGSVEVGKRADLILIDGNGDLKLTMIGGKVVLNEMS
jgi:N-acetylglucosamine-6-phosphate deacetylase